MRPLQEFAQFGVRFAGGAARPATGCVPKYLAQAVQVTTSALLGALVMTLAACSSSAPESAASAGASATLEEHVYTVCPTELATANGAACKSEGLSCTFGFACGAWTQNAACRCQGGRFECHDPVGPLAPEAAPRCAGNDPGPTPDDCPPSRSAALGASCNVVGRSCFYAGPVCPEYATGKAKLASCECSAQGDGAMVYVCPQVACNPLFQPGDATTNPPAASAP